MVIYNAGALGVLAFMRVVLGFGLIEIRIQLHPMTGSQVGWKRWKREI